MIRISCQLVSDYIWLSVIKDEPLSKELPKASVKLFLHATGNIAAKFLYDQVLPSICLQCVSFFIIECDSYLAYTLCFILYQVLVAAFRKIPKASWNAKERSVCVFIFL